MNTYIGKNTLKMLKLNKCLPSFCTSNIDVLKSIIIFAKFNNLPLLIESTSNQVNQFGGYTGLNSKQFYKKIHLLAYKLNYKKHFLHVGADHLGPLPWKNLKSQKAMRNSIKLFKDAVNAGYNKIHIDTGMKLKSDKILSKKKIIERCSLIFNSVKNKNLKKISFVFGTEVPIAGGTKSYALKNTSLSSIKDDYQNYNSLKNYFSLVIEPGLGFTNTKIHKLKMNSFKKKKNISITNNFSYEAHSSDYQNLSSLKNLIRNNFKFLKVGPELTYFYMKSILKMEKIEKINYLTKLSNIQNTISKEMDKDKKHWKNYYFGNLKKIEFLKFNSLLDRSRYYWNKKNIVKSLLILKNNINLLEDKIFLKNLSIFKDQHKLKKKFKLNNFDFLIYCYLNSSLSKYYRACQFNTK
jgi:D-tagatose-1,6-bisphosphate aldolase subunit GatZ/KbaZ